MLALDTNILIYAHRSQAPAHAPIRKALEELFIRQTQWGIPLPCLAEFWGVVTHPAVSSRPSTADEAHSFLTHLLEDGCGTILYPKDNFGPRLTRHATRLQVFGNRIFDLQIALTAADNGATALWSCDRHFISLPGLQVVNPASS